MKHKRTPLERRTRCRLLNGSRADPITTIIGVYGPPQNCKRKLGWTLGDSFGIDVVALVRLYLRLDELGGHQTYLVTFEFAGLARGNGLRCKRPSPSLGRAHWRCTPAVVFANTSCERRPFHSNGGEPSDSRSCPSQYQSRVVPCEIYS